MLTTCLDALGLDSVHLVGHSQGAMIGLWLALDAPDRVRSLTAIGTPAVALGNRLEGLKVLARPGIGRLMLSMPKPPPMYRRILTGTIGRRAVEAAPPDLIRATYLGTQRPGFGRTVSTYLREMFRGVEAKPQRYVLRDDELARIQPPTLVIWGRDEESVPPIADVRQRVALIANARLELVPGGHEPWLDDLESTARHIASFHSGLRAKEHSRLTG
jgi:pimeloyl-[acyl-carrier protein] methyl ester esterase